MKNHRHGMQGLLTSSAVERASIPRCVKLAERHQPKVHDNILIDSCHIAEYARQHIHDGKAHQ
jgi:hypothetical protein